MDTSKYIKECSRCHTEIEPVRYATEGDKAIGGVSGLSGTATGSGFGGSIGAVIGGSIGYFAGKSAGDENMNQDTKLTSDSLPEKTCLT